jgi:hypothetical protein
MEELDARYLNGMPPVGRESAGGLIKHERVNSMINETINWLGLRARDKVTGFEGVIASVHFDLYGCVQVVITPPKMADGKLGDGHYFDVHRIELIPGERVMPVPDFQAVARKPSEYNHGPAEKPLPK